MIFDILKDSFEYSQKDKFVYLKLVLLSLLSFLLIPITIICGYLYRIIFIGINSMINSDDPMPKFDNWKELIIQGLKILIVSFVYMLPTIILGYIIVYNRFLININTNLSSIHLETGFGFLAIIGILWIISFLMIMVATPHMIANKGSLKKAFNIKEIFSIIKFVGLVEYLKFILNYVIIVIGIIFILFLLTEVLINLLNMIAISLFKQHIWLLINDPINIVIFMTIFFVILKPILIMIRSRSMALLYNMTGNTFVNE